MKDRAVKYDFDRVAEELGAPPVGYRMLLQPVCPEEPFRGNYSTYVDLLRIFAAQNIELRERLSLATRRVLFMCGHYHTSSSLEKEGVTLLEILGV